MYNSEMDFRGWSVVTDRLGHAMITKCEVPNFARYGNIKRVAKCRKWGYLEWLEVIQGHHSIQRI